MRWTARGNCSQCRHLPLVEAFSSKPYLEVQVLDGRHIQGTRTVVTEHVAERTIHGSSLSHVAVEP